MGEPAMMEFDFEEKIHKEFFLPLYTEKGYAVIQDNVGKPESCPYDVVVEKDGIQRRIDEKVLRKKWEGMVIEIIQHIGNEKGSWLHHDKDDYLYAECEDGKEKVSRLHVVSHHPLRDFIFEKKNWEKYSLRPQVSLKGWGITIFVVVPWDILIERKIAARIESISLRTLSDEIYDLAFKSV